MYVLRTRRVVMQNQMAGILRHLRYFCPKFESALSFFHIMLKFLIPFRFYFQFFILLKFHLRGLRHIKPDQHWRRCNNCVAKKACSVASSRAVVVAAACTQTRGGVSRFRERSLLFYKFRNVSLLVCQSILSAKRLL